MPAAFEGDAGNIENLAVDIGIQSKREQLAEMGRVHVERRQNSFLGVGACSGIVIVLGQNRSLSLNGAGAENKRRCSQQGTGDERTERAKSRGSLRVHRWQFFLSKSNVVLLYPFSVSAGVDKSPAWNVRYTMPAPAAPVTLPPVVLPAPANFDGPLDLLLHLIREHRIDIADIPIVLVTDHYLASLRAMEAMNLNVAGEFLLMAATLLEIKSRMLLPKPPRINAAEEGEDPGWSLSAAWKITSATRPLWKR